MDPPLIGSGIRITGDNQAETPLGYTYSVETTTPNVALVPVLRSGLGMLEGRLSAISPESSSHQVPPALQTLLPELVPVHHLGLFREPTSLQPVEYYNNLPYHHPTSVNPDPFPIPSIAILLDPVIATGGTSSAAIQTLLEWGVRKVVVISVLGSEEGVRRAAEENGSESVEIWVGGLDKQVDERGMIRPGLGDVGDRLYLTIGK